MRDYLVYDVFTDRPFGGNQLAVFPDARDLPETDLQKIAAEFNFSEVTFVYPPEDAENTAKVRIFTPTMEVPFAGHPTIGTAIALNDLGHGPDMVLELGIGPLACRAEGGSAQFTTTADLELSERPDPALVHLVIDVSRAARPVPLQGEVSSAGLLHCHHRPRHPESVGYRTRGAARRHRRAIGISAVHQGIAIVIETIVTRHFGRRGRTAIPGTTAGMLPDAEITNGIAAKLRRCER